MKKLILGVAGLLLTASASAYITHYPAYYPSCVNSKAITHLSDIKHKVIICPKGHITVGVLPRTHYDSFALAYNNFCRNIKLKFSTNSANVLIDDWQYYKTDLTLSAQQPKGMMRLPDIKTGKNKGVVKITNESDTSICLGQQCLYQ